MGHRRTKRHLKTLVSEVNLTEESKKILLFGDGRFAELAWYVLTHDSPHDVVAFVVDGDFLNKKNLFGIPIIAFEDCVDRYSPDDFSMIVPLGYQGLNSLRQKKYLEAKSKGYGLISYLSSRASSWDNVSIGENCMIYENVTLQPFSKIGNNTIVRSSVHISHHVEVEEHCFISAGTCIGGSSKIGKSSFLGLSSTVRDNLAIAEKSFIAAGSVVVNDTESNGLYLGVPAKKTSKPADEAL